MLRESLPRLVLVAAATASCNGGQAAAPVAEHPSGAVVRAGDIYIYAREVESWLSTIALIEVDETEPSLKRKALSNILIPLAVARSLDPAAYEAARERAAGAHETLLAGGELDPTGPQTEELEGIWLRSQGIGLDVWGLARGMPTGEWVIIESVGAFVVFRVLEAPPYEEWSGGTKIRVEKLVFPYLPPEKPWRLLQQAIDRTEFEVVDPTYREIVPDHFEYSRRTIR